MKIDTQSDERVRERGLDMIIRQTYTCKGEMITIRFHYSEDSSIESAEEVDRLEGFNENELTVPDAEVTRDFFDHVKKKLGKRDETNERMSGMQETRTH